MKIVVIMLNLLLCAFSAHDISMAVFKIYEVEDSMQLAISLDVGDFCQVVGMEPEKISKAVVEDYLTAHFSISFDGVTCEYVVEEIITQRDHFKVKASINVEVHEYKVIEITNDCLLDIDNQSNIIQVEMNQSFRDFHMNKKRQFIKVEY